MKAPNEKLIETLFTYYALRFLDGEGVSVYTPSSREEYFEGYDAKLMGASSFDELYVQFKTPRCLARAQWRYGFHTTGHQHRRLKVYPPNTAFYVTHTFRTVTQIQKAQRELTPEQFLRRYVAIEIWRLEDDVKFFRYQTDQSFMPWQVVYNQRVDLKPRTPTHYVEDEDGGWMLGDELLKRFQAGELGAWVMLEGPPVGGTLRNIGEADQVAPPRRAEPWEVPPRAGLRKLCPPDESEEWGTSIRRNIEPLPTKPGKEGSVKPG